jgi:virginiamycin B lyase
VRSHIGFFLASLLVLALGLAARAEAVTITEFPIGPGSAPRYIHPGPDGNLWFTDGGSNPGIGRIDTTGQFLPTISDPNDPVDLVTLPDGSVLWTGDSGFGLRRPDGGIVTRNTGYGTYGIALMLDGTPRFTAGVSNGHGVCRVTDFSNLDFACSVETGGRTRLTGLALGSDGRLWAAGPEANVIYRLDPNGEFHDQELDLPTGTTPARLALASDGNLWVTMYGPSAIDRITPSATRFPPFPLPPGSGPNDITVGPDGALWITEYDAGRIDRMALDGTVTNKFPLPTANAHPAGITVGPDGAIWFTELGAGKIGRLQLDSAGGGSGGVVDNVAPRFTRGASFSHRRFRVAAGRTPVSARSVPRGTVLSYSLSEPAKATIIIARKAPGRHSNGLCRAPSHSNRGARHCTRWVNVGVLTRSALQGANSLTFTGRIGRRALKPHAYRATVMARDAAGNASTGSSARFTIVR